MSAATSRWAISRAVTAVGTRMRAVNLVAGTETEVEIVSPHFVDPEGERLRG